MGHHLSSIFSLTILIGYRGAATEAALEGIPSTAFSASGSSLQSVSFTTLTTSPNSSSSKAARIYADLTTKFTNAILASSARPILPASVSINVNYPPVTSRCASAANFRFVLTRVSPNSKATDVNTCGTTHLLGESNVVGRSDCSISVSVMDAKTKSDVNAATQQAVLNRISTLLSCLPN